MARSDLDKNKLHSLFAYPDFTSINENVVISWLLSLVISNMISPDGSNA